MKLFTVLAIAILFAACNNEQQSEIPAQRQPVDPPQSILGVADTGTAVSQPAPSRESVFPAGKYRSLDEIMADCFSEGSTKAEVRRVQGEPDFIETSYPFENWYYGTCLVQFNGPLVRAVKNTDQKLKYADYLALALSPDKVEIEFYLLLNTRINRR